MKRRSQLTVCGNEDVPESITAFVKELGEKIKEHVELKGCVRIVIVPAVSYPSYRRKFVVGQFYRNPHTIYVCGLKPKGMSAREFRESVTDTVLHELAHLMQWLETKRASAVNERGIESRVKALTERMGL